MSKRAKMEKYFNEEYNNICKKLYNDYMIGLKKKLSNDGHSQFIINEK